MSLITILSSIILLASLNLEAKKIIASTKIYVDKQLAANNIRDLENYLKRFVGMTADNKNKQGAEDFLNTLFFVSKAHCKLNNIDDDAKLICNVEPKYLVREININNLRPSLLESELKRKLPVQVGHLIDFNQESVNEISNLTRARIETFLRKSGFYGGRVTVAVIKDPDALTVKVEADIKKGAFARVNEVRIEGDSPLNPDVVRNIYQRMCLSFNRIFDAITLGFLSCYSAELEREATEQLQERLAELGYVQASIRVKHQWIDAHDKNAPKFCQKKDPTDFSSRCLNLRIDINKGPLVRWSITMKDGRMFKRNAFTRFMSSFFAVDALSRATQSNDIGDIATDRMIIKEELEKRVNFIEAKNLDEQALSSSVQKMTEYLVSKGYINAKVIPVVKKINAQNISVNFDIYAGQAFSISEVSIAPEPFTKLYTEEDIDSLLETRSLTSPGNLSYPKVDEALLEVEQSAQEKGYYHATSKVQMSSLDKGDVKVDFFLSGDKREIISSLSIINGFEKINEQLIPTLKNCDTTQKKAVACQGSSLVRNSIESDETKIANVYQANDYLYAKVRSELIEEETGYKLIFYVFDERYGEDKFKPLTRQRIKNIIISGNRNTNESVIKRLFPKTRNKEYNSLSIKKGLANLRESGRFQRIDHKLLAAQDKSDDVYFVMQVVERPSLTLDTGISISTDQLLSLEAEVEENNLFSSMLTLKTKLALGFFWGRHSSLTNKFVWPFIGGKPLSFSLYAPMITYDDKSHQREPFRRLKSSIVAGLEWRASSLLLPYIRYSFIHSKTKTGAPRLSLAEQFKTLDGLIPLIKEKEPGKFAGVLTPGLAFIKLDNPFDPHSGMESHNWVEISGGLFQGNPPFINFGTQNRLFVPLGPLTLALQLTLMRAFIEPNEENFKHLREFSSYMDLLGGDKTVRGYKDDDLGIRAPNGSAGSYAGYFSNVANVELRFPLTSGGTIGKLSGAIFADQGLLMPCTSLWNCHEERPFNEIVNKKGFGFSLGAGLRYILPVGPISLDYAYSPLHDVGRVHFQFGYAF